MPGTTIYTNGHSTRTFDEFAKMLAAHGITKLVDVRTVPRSRRHPHFSNEALGASLPAVGIEYSWVRELGGLRKPHPDSVNTGWRNQSFRGYADHMQAPEFAEGSERRIRPVPYQLSPPPGGGHAPSMRRSKMI